MVKCTKITPGNLFWRKIMSGIHRAHLFVEMTLRSNLAVEIENQRFFAGLAAPGVLWWLNCVWLMNPRRVNDPCAPWGWYLPFVTRETALTPPLGSSNGPFLAVPAVFLWFRPGAGAQRGLRPFYFPLFMPRNHNESKWSSTTPPCAML